MTSFYDLSIPTFLQTVSAVAESSTVPPGIAMRLAPNLTTWLFSTLLIRVERGHPSGEARD